MAFLLFYIQLLKNITGQVYYLSLQINIVIRKCSVLQVLCHPVPACMMLVSGYSEPGTHSRPCFALQIYKIPAEIKRKKKEKKAKHGSEFMAQSQSQKERNLNVVMHTWA